MLPRMGEPVFTSCRRKVKDRRLVASSRLLLYRIAEPGYGSDILIPRIYEFLYEFLYVCFSVAKLLSYHWSGVDFYGVKCPAFAMGINHYVLLLNQQNQMSIHVLCKPCERARCQLYQQQASLLPIASWVWMAADLADHFQIGQIPSPQLLWEGNDLKPPHKWWCFSRMHGKGSRFTLGVWGLRVCSLDVAFMFATVRNRSQPFATGRNRPQPFAGECVRPVWPCLW